MTAPKRAPSATRPISAADLAKTSEEPITDAETPKAKAAAKAKSKKTEAAPRVRRLAPAVARPTLGSPRRATIAPLPQLTPYAAPQVRAHETRVYGPDKKRHMSEMGPVAASNWIGIVNGLRVSVKIGAPQSTIPEEIQALMEESGVGFDIALPPTGRGAVTLPEPRAEEPKARRTQRRETERSFAPLRAMPIE